MTGLFPELLETDRLRLEVVDPESTAVFEHYDAFSDDSDPETVYEYVPLSEPATPAESRAFIESTGSNRDDGDAVTYVIRPLESQPRAGEFAGTTTLFVQWDRNMAQSAILLRKPFWGRGYSSERAEALLELAFERLDLGAFAVSCVAGNDRSKRAIEKYVAAHGGEYDGRFRHLHAIDGDPVDLHRFSIPRGAYRTAVADAD